MNLKRRLKALEKGLISLPITLLMPDGNTVMLRGGGHLVDLARAILNSPTEDAP
jgi:hypothetical protein